MELTLIKMKVHSIIINKPLVCDDGCVVDEGSQNNSGGDAGAAAIGESKETAKCSYRRAYARKKVSVQAGARVRADAMQAHLPALPRH